MRKIKVGDYVQLFTLRNSEIHGCSRHENGDPKRITKILVDSVEDSTLKVMVEGSETSIWVSYRDCTNKGGI